LEQRRACEAVRFRPVATANPIHTVVGWQIG
jgi:hypothetical protein